MQVSLDRQQGANAWVTVGLREGKNREIRRAMDSIGLPVNRLIRVSYGPFQLGNLKPGEVEELRRKVLRDQLGLEAEDDPKPASRPRPARKPGPRSKSPNSGPKGPGGPPQPGKGSGKPAVKRGGTPGVRSATPRKGPARGKRP